MELGILALPCMSRYDSATEPGKELQIKGWMHPTLVAALTACALIYYLACFASTDYSILRLAKLKADIRLLCDGEPHEKFGYRYKVFLMTEVRSPPSPLDFQRKELLPCG